MPDDGSLQHGVVHGLVDQGVYRVDSTRRWRRISIGGRRDAPSLSSQQRIDVGRVLRDVILGFVHGDIENGSRSDLECDRNMFGARIGDLGTEEIPNLGLEVGDGAARRVGLAGAQ